MGGGGGGGLKHGGRPPGAVARKKNSQLLNYRVLSIIQFIIELLSNFVK